MFILYVNKNQLIVCQGGPITSGSVNAYDVRFEFSADWEGLTRIAVFKYGGTSASVLLDDTNECVIPWEVLTAHGRNLVAGVYGKSGDRIVLPTVWESLGKILEGVTTGPGAQPPTPQLWEQELAQKGDRLDYTSDGELGLYAGDKLLSAAPVAGGGGGGGTSDHRRLSHRDAEGQHPIEAISGLDEISNKRVLEIWNGVMDHE